IITDNDKSMDLGSDIERLAHLGVAVKTDNTDYHMHHKFAVFDNKILLTGSYNWTRSATLYNQENLLTTHDRKLVSEYSNEFERLWLKMTRYDG
ncbi:MAG: phospholipase D-like domain-containing protein, partial [Thiohalomonadales bacterium]